jgi:hypothetical protein
MSIESLMDQVVTLYRGGIRQDATGGQGASAFAQDKDAVNVACSIQPASASTQLRYMQRRMTVSHTLYFDADWKPTLADKWVRSPQGNVYVVRGWYNSLEFDDCWVCDCEELPVPGRAS